MTPKSISIRSSNTLPNVIKKYNQRMSKIDLVDQRAAAYDLDCKWSIYFNCLFFSA